MKAPLIGFLAFTIGITLLLLVVTGGFNDPETNTACTTPASLNDDLSNNRTFTSEMATNATTITTVGTSLDIATEGQVIALATALVESGLINVTYGDRDSVGLFQQRPSQGWGTAEQIMDPTHSATKFYEALLAVEGWETMTPGDAAQIVQRSAFPTRYADAIADARRIHASIYDQTTPVDCATPGKASGDQTDVNTRMGTTITVDSSLAAPLQQLLNDAATDNIILGGWGYRPPEAQIRLRKKHCGTSNYAIYEKPSGQCNPPTATPGRSQHENGLAIDFTCNGNRIAGTACFTWLKQNAHRYGLKNLPSEPWHWSTTGK